MPELDLGYEYVDKYILLRKHGKIGVLWYIQGGIALVTPPPTLLRDEAQPIPLDEFKNQIDYWFPTILLPRIVRKPVSSQESLRLNRKWA